VFLLLNLHSVCRAQIVRPPYSAAGRIPSAAKPSPAQPASGKPVREGAPEPGTWNVRAVTQESVGSVYRLRGRAQLENASMIFRADEIDYDGSSGDLEARGNVYFKHFERNEELWASRVEYNTDQEKGKFFDVRGQGQPRIDARPGVLTSASPFYFQGEWAERTGNRYILHNGFITNCKMPRPWWKLHGPVFDIAPGDRAVARNTTFAVRKFPVFFTPFFYKSLEKVPRRSGFLTPNIGNSSRRGKLIGLGYFWAINRSYDVTYRVQDFTERGFAHHVDFRGKPREGTDFDAIFYGVQDRGLKQGDSVRKEGGSSLYMVGKSDIGHGFTAHGMINYITTFRFRQAFTESYNEVVNTEVHSVGFINKNWSSFTCNAVFARLENFQRQEVEVRDPVTGALRLEADSVILRKLPEVELTSRHRQIWSRLPVWFSLQSSAGLLYRAQPVFDGDTLIDKFQTGHFMNRLNLAPHVSTALRWKGFHLIPGFGVRETYYGEAQRIENGRYHIVGTNLVRSARDLSADLVFPSLERIFNQKTRFGDKLKHVIEPRATWRYVTGVGDDYNRFIRFDETDLLSNTNELEISLTNRLYAKRGNHVVEILSWQLWQKRYFDPTFGGALLPGRRNVVESTVQLTPYTFLTGPRTASPIVSVLRASPTDRFGMEWRADYDPVRGGITNSTLSADYRWHKAFVSMGHNQVHTDPILTSSANQIRGFIGYGERSRRGWNAGFTTIYDFRKGSMQYSTTEIAYNTDCCGLSLQVRRFDLGGSRNETQWRVAFAIANIGTFGTLKKQERMF
jgi:LPS-assembly protein